MKPSEKGLLLNGDFIPWSEITNSKHRGIPEICKQWMSGNGSFSFMSSGSTGASKEIILERTQLETSALMSRYYLELGPEENSLCCLPAEKTGGAMVLVRSMLFNWNCRYLEASSNPMLSLDTVHNYKLCSLVPLQLEEILQDHESIQKLNRFRCILIGGTGISPPLEKQLKVLKPNIYHTYGMTETASHIALRRINGSEASAWFDVLPGNQIDQGEDDCLRIKGAVTLGHWIQTHDQVEIKGNKFRFVGRTDFVINTGGVKVQPELVEQELSDWMAKYAPGRRYMISSRPDEKLGERVVLLLEGLQPLENFPPEALFSPYHKPRQLKYCNELPFSDTGKPLRKEALNV